MASEFTVADVLAWARTKPADERYDYCSAHDCAIAQFGRETGRPELIGIGVLSAMYPTVNDLVQDNDAEAEQDWTFGGLVTRCEKLLGAPPAKPSPWLNPDAYINADCGKQLA